MASRLFQIPADKSGRIVLPKEIRDHLGIIAGTEFEIEERDNGIFLKPIHQEPKITEKNGWLVVSFGADHKVTPQDVREEIENSRRESRWS